MVAPEQPTPQDNFRVLTIDGGGIKGVYTSHMLAAIESQLCPGKSIGRYFDMICGTSTGSIIAVALASGKTAQEIAEAYDKLGPKVFPSEGRLRAKWRGLKSAVWSAKYDPSPLLESLELLTEGRRFSEAMNYLCIPVTVANTAHPRVYRTRHSRMHSWPDCRLADIAVASAAAPTYFPLVPTPAFADPETHYADGGLFANNPSLVGLMESFKIFVGEKSERNSHQHVDVLSFGSFPSPGIFTIPPHFANKAKVKEEHDKLLTRWRSKSGLHWMNPFPKGPPLVSVVLDAQAMHTAWVVKDMQKFTPGFRRYVRLDALNNKVRATPIDSLTGLQIDDASPHAMRTMASRGKEDGLVAASEPDVRAFFHAAIQPIQLTNIET